MNTHATSTASSPASAQAAPLQIVLTYDIPAMAAAGRNILNGFLKKWAADIETHRDEWSFTELEHPKFRSEALELAANSDIFVIALSGLDDLPESFLDWLIQWMQIRARMETAMILFVASRNACISILPRCQSLPDLARENNIYFLTTTVTLPESIIPAACHPRALLKRIESINPDLLPDFSGLNE